MYVCMDVFFMFVSMLVFYYFLLLLVVTFIFSFGFLFLYHLTTYIYIHIHLLFLVLYQHRIPIAADTKQGKTRPIELTFQSFKELSIPFIGFWRSRTRKQELVPTQTATNFDIRVGQISDFFVARQGFPASYFLNF